MEKNQSGLAGWRIKVLTRNRLQPSRIEIAEPHSDILLREAVTLMVAGHNLVWIELGESALFCPGNPRKGFTSTKDRTEVRSLDHWLYPWWKMTPIHSCEMLWRWLRRPESDS